MKISPSMERRIWKGVTARSENILLELNKLINDEERFNAIPPAALAAYYLKRYAEAADLANQCIKSAESFRDSWNYSNALHYGHTVLGLLAIKNGDLQLAIEELHASASVEGSPQLKSFGPSALLARELLKKGRTQEVLIFLQKCKAFWKMGGKLIQIWEKKIMRGVIPNFLMNRYM